MQEMTLSLPSGKHNNNEDSLYVRNLAKFMSEYDTYTGPVRTQLDMSADEIAAIEKQYGAKVQMHHAIETHGTLDDRSVSQNWFYRNRMKKLAKKRIAEQAKGANKDAGK